MDTTQYTSLFLDEMRDNTAKLSQLMIRLEKESDNAAILSDIMRISHSCKGACATMGFEKTTELCHALEDLFDAARNGTCRVTSVCIDVTLQAIDALSEALGQMEKTGTEPGVFAITQVLRDTAAGKEPTLSSSAGSTPTDGMASSHIRIDAKKLDALLDLTGELSTLRLELSTVANHAALKPVLEPLVNRLTRLLSELAYQVSESRLVPVEQAFAQFPRLVRDLSRTQGKNVQFKMTGTDMELDKTLIDHLASPIIHLLRNAVDHGIESPTVRQTAGKKAEAIIELSIRREGGYVMVDVSDDGAPIQVETIKKQAHERGFTPEEIAAIDAHSLLDILASARFSSSQNVGMISGRGIGLSAVRATVKSLGGQLSLVQKQDKKTFTLMLPLQVSSLRAVLVRIGGKMYAFPFMHIEKLMQIEPAEIHTTLNQPSFVLQGRDVPIINLQQLLWGAETGETATHAMNILLLQHGSEHIGLLVDDIIRNEEVMVKPIPDTLQSAGYFSGYTILGDGGIALILDTQTIVASVINRTLA